ncbi:MAG: hypothetical protein PHZ09_00505 [Eubacteriales bacterium]|nr:hypothetical protein [Eubacteriales bacterium]
MSYPDLMFLSGRGTVKTDPSVFEDLKLNALIREDITQVMRNVCCAEDILARQDMFRAIAAPKTRNHFRKLSDDMQRVSSLAERYADARCDNERNFLYLNLAGELSEFFSDAASLECDNILYKRFRDYFISRLSRGNCRQLMTDTETLLPKVRGALVSNYKLADNKLRIADEKPVTYMSRLLECAANLGLTGVKPQRMAPKTLDPSIINATAKLYPDIFASVAAFYNKHKNFFEPEILRYKAEIDFYLVIAEMADRVKDAGIPVIFPKISDTPRIDIINAYDITLLTKGEKNIIPDDISFYTNEPFFYLTGANGGGKTTYLRTVGVCCLLFANGCPIPCDSAEIYPPKGVFTHFPRDERFNNAGRYAEEQNRIDIMLQTLEELSDGQGYSLVLLNETYSTTSEEKACLLTSQLAEKLYHSGNFGIYVTHQHSVGETVPYLNVLVDRDDSNRRTFKVAKQKSVYSSLAYDILKKYRLTGEDLDRRFI